MLFASECQSHLMPRNFAVRGLVGHTLIHKSEFGVVVDKSALTGQDNTFAALFLRIGYTIALEEIEGCIADQKTVEDEIEARELARIIEAFLDTLTVKERVIFMRRYAYADTYADIAKRVGISEKNVSVRLALIRQKMKQYLIEREVLV